VETVHHPELLELGVRLFREIGYRGVGSAEFKYDERDREFKLIEINPRYWQQCALAEKAGMNIPLLDYREARGEAPEAITDWRAGEKWVSPVSDWETAREMHRLGALSYRAWIGSLRGAQLSNFALHDPLPGLWAWAQAVRVRVERRLRPDRRRVMRAGPLA
jgi:predicted ATP-grasp superfamily ATP-dependent carboligase